MSPLGGSPPVVWYPNVEALMLLVNLTEEGARCAPKAMNAVRRAARLRYDARRAAPAVQETAALMREGLWLDSFMEVALSADALPRVAFTSTPSRETAARAAGRALDFDPSAGMARLERYLEFAANFVRQEDVQDFLKTHTDAYRQAVGQLEGALVGFTFVGDLEQYFGTHHRSYLNVASLLTPAGFSFGLAVQTGDAPLAFHVAGPFLEPDGRITFASNQQAAISAEREFTRAFIKPLLGRRRLDTKPFEDAFARAREFMLRIGYDSPAPCLEDHLVQTIHAAIMAKRGERAAADAILRFDEESGFIFTRAFAEGLGHYEAHRTEYRDFEAFFPTLMDLFLQLKGS